MIKQELRRGIRRLTSLGALTALAGGALTMGLVAPAHAVDNVSGSVVDAAGNPAQGFVNVYETDGSPFTSDFVTNGHIGLELPAGGYKIRFDPFDSELESEYYLNKADFATGDTVVVAAAGAALQPWTIDRRPFVTGTVTDAAGRPISNADVEATAAADGTEAGSTDTDEKGVFTLPVDTSDVKLRFSADDFATEYFNDKPSLATADVVTATSAGANVGAVVLTAGSSINGVVTSDAGAPLELVTVFATDATTGATLGSDRTDKTGTYHVENLPGGSYKLEYFDSLDEYIGEFYNNVATEAAATPVAIAPNSPAGLPTVTLTPAPVVAPDSPVDVTGAVTDESGVPIAGVGVTAYNTPADPDDRIDVEETFTNRAGIYSFTTLDQVPNETQFKVLASGFGEREETTFGARSNWFGNSVSFENAALVTTTAPVTGVNIFMEYFGGISGTVTSEAGLSVADSFVTFYNADGIGVDSAGVKTDGTYETRGLIPGTYKVLFGGGDHVFEWYDSAVIEDAKTITVKTNAMTGGINAALGNVLKAIERPSTSDYPWVGTTFTADKGRWNQETNSKFTYEWLAGGAVVATGQSFVPTTALIGKKLSVRVTNQSGKLKASATSASTQKVGLKPKVKAKAQGKSLAVKVKVKGLKAKKVKGSVIVKEIVGVKNNGELKLKKVGKAKVKKGKATVSLAKLKKDKGKDKLQVVFIGKGKAGSTEITKKVKR